MNNNNKEKEPWTGSSTNPFQIEGLNSNNSVDQQDPAVNTDVIGDITSITIDGNDTSSTSNKPSKARKSSVCIDDVRSELRMRGIDIRRNEISGLLQIQGMPTPYSVENAANTLPVLLADEIKKSGRPVTRKTVEDALMVIADENRFNPVMDMLTDTTYDGKDRITEYYEILGIQNDTWSCNLHRHWFHQSIAMILNNDKAPYGADGMLVYQGNQGIGKTLALSKLAYDPDLFAEGIVLDMNKKDSIVQSTAVWIAELGELDSTLKKEQSSLKAFITRRHDLYRLPYAASHIRKVRHTSFCATVNPMEFISDDTGSRRFWTVHLDTIDVNRLLALDSTWAKQFWRQVYEQLYLQDPQGFRLTTAERKELEIRNRVYLKPLAGEIDLRNYLDFDLSKNAWKWYRIRTLLDLLDLRGVSSSQLGKVLNKLSRENPDIRVKNTHNVKEYFLPMV